MSGTTVEIDPELCENNQNCEAVCPVDVFEIERGSVVVRRPNECTLCFKCVELCPSGAVSVDF
jgi:NAD-dependent dihydropyrimidine dehydrogenase PreA subunit